MEWWNNGIRRPGSQEKQRLTQRGHREVFASKYAPIGAERLIFLMGIRYLAPNELKEN
jgi:hypothetical protein